MNIYILLIVHEEYTENKQFECAPELIILSRFAGLGSHSKPRERANRRERRKRERVREREREQLKIYKWFL
jgi:hypothetical protein